MEKRTLVALLLSLIILIGYHIYFAPQPADVNEEEKDLSRKEVPEEKGREILPQKEELLKEKPGKDKERFSSVILPTEEEIGVETELYSAVFTNYGARLKSFKLKKYNDKLGDGAQCIELINTKKREDLPLSVIFKGSPQQDHSCLVFKASKNFLNLGGEIKKGEIIFTAKSEGGLKVVKRFTFFADSYNFDLDFTIFNQSDGGVEGEVTLEWLHKIDKSKESKGSGFFRGRRGRCG